MPTYDYQCAECGAVFDVFQSIKASPLKKALCKTCGVERPVKRLIGTGGAVIFKGSGFYQTDYRSAAYSKAAKAETDSGKKDDTKSADSANKSASSTGKESPAKSEPSSKKPQSPKSPSD